MVETFSRNSAHAAPEQSDETLITGEAVALMVRPTSFILRVAGCLIDVLLSAVVFVLGLWTIFSLPATDEALVNALVIADLAFSIVVVPVLVELLMAGRSLGRLAVGARIVRDDGGGIRFRHTLVRAIMGIAEIYLTFGGLASLVSLLHPKAKRLGDVLAGTYSQHERVPKLHRAAFDVPVELTEWSKVADVAALSDRLARRIAQFMLHAPSMTDSSRRALAVELANETAQYVHPLPDCEPEYLLAAVTALRRRRDARALESRDRVLDSFSPMLNSLPHQFSDR